MQELRQMNLDTMLGKRPRQGASPSLDLLEGDDDSSLLQGPILSRQKRLIIEQELSAQPVQDEDSLIPVSLRNQARERRIYMRSETGSKRDRVAS